MKRSSLFGHVIELHDVIRAGNRPADAVVKEFFRSRHYLGSKDRRFISELLFGMFRHFRLIQAYAEQSFRSMSAERYTAPIPAVVLVATYCARVLNEPLEELFHDVSGLWRVYCPDTECEPFLQTVSSVALSPRVDEDQVLNIGIRWSFPELIVREWIGRYGEEETKLLCTALNSHAPITVRVNTLATTAVECQSALQKEGIEAQRTHLSPVGLVLPKRINVQALQSFRHGFFEMQDEGSQLISMLVQPVPGSTVVDACAGGGGKTLHLAALIMNRGRIIAIEVEQQRLNNIHERLRRAGVSIVQTSLAGQYQDVISAQGADAVLIDAPCSGVGAFRRNPASKATFTESFVDTLVQKQAGLLDQYSVLVKPGGRLVYSTCTLIKRENEDQVSAFLERHADFELLSAPEILSQQEVTIEAGTPYLTLLPHKTMTDGFFAAVLLRR